MSRLHRRRFAAALGGLSAAALTLGGLAAVAPADAYVGTPGTGMVPASYGPDLISVSKTATANVAEYCFDEALKTASASSIVLRSYDAGRAWIATSATINANRTSCVDATFSSNEIAAQATTGFVGGSAVTDAAGLGNPGESAPFSGGSSAPRSGQTTGPDLVSTSVDSTGKNVTFTFDANVQGGATVTAGRFYAISAGGAQTAASSVSSVSGHSVHVAFATTQAAAVGFAVSQGAVRSAEHSWVSGAGSSAAGCGLTKTSGSTTVADCTAIPSPLSALYRSSTAFPRLAAGSYAGGKVTLRWTGAVTSKAPTAVYAILDNGNAVAATGLDATLSSTTYRYTFGSPVTAEPSAVVAYVAGAGAVGWSSPSSANASVPTSRVNVGTAPMTRGRTNGPDLLRVSVNATAHQATFSFDEAVKASSVSAASFKLLFSNIGAVGGTGTPTVSGGNVTVTYAGDVATAVGGIAVGETDAIGNPGSQGSVSTRLVATTTTTGHASACPAATAKVKKLTKKLHKAVKHHKRAAVKKLKKKLRKAKHAKRLAC